VYCLQVRLRLVCRVQRCYEIKWNHVPLACHLSRLGLVRGCDLKRLITLDLCLRRADPDKLVRSTHGAVLSILRNCCELIFVFVALYQSAADNRVCVRLNGQHFPPAVDNDEAEVQFG
jgi:hypothetical protein